MELQAPMWVNRIDSLPVGRIDTEGEGRSMDRTVTERILDVIEAVDKIERYTSGLTRAEFETQRGIQLIVERLAITIGEALDKARDLDRTMEATIPGMGQAIAVGSHILHTTSGIDPVMLWETVVDKGPKLREPLRLALEVHR
jgi:uncharacterized protein with HEPN domain